MQETFNDCVKNVVIVIRQENRKINFRHESCDDQLLRIVQTTSHWRFDQFINKAILILAFLMLFDRPTVCVFTH